MKILIHLFFYYIFFNLFCVKEVVLQTKIVNGEDTEITKIPYIGVLETLISLCTLSIYTAEYVVTAAHCAELCKIFLCKVKVGETDYTKASGINVVSTYIHPNYNAVTSSNDIALLKLAEPLTFSDKIQPIALQEDEIEVVTGAPVLIAGWGLLSEGGESTKILQSANVSIVDRYECNKNYSCENQKCDGTCCEKEVINKNMICAAAPKTDTCQGDSGGPMVLNSSGKQVGITSFGRGCARDGYPGVYTYIPKYVKWIKTCVTGGYISTLFCPVKSLLLF